MEPLRELKYNVCNVDFEITYKCNFKCPYCAVKPRLHEEDKDFDVEGAVKILRHFIELSIKANVPTLRVHIAGGEPTLHPRFDEVYTTFHNIVAEYVDHFEIVDFSVPTNFPKMPLVMLKNDHPKIQKKIVIAVHPESKPDELHKRVMTFNRMNKALKNPVEISVIFLYSEVPAHQKKTMAQMDEYLQIFENEPVIVHMNPMVHYWKNPFTTARPNIKEDKLCKSLNWVIDEDLQIKNACQWYKLTDVMSWDKFPDEPTRCTHLCFEDYSRIVYDKIFLYSDDKDFRYFNTIPEKYRGTGE